MANELSPIVDQWYQYVESGELMRVVAIDRSEGTIEIQRFDGNLEEIDLEEWDELGLQLAEAPEDWTGPYDDADVEQADDVTQSGLILDWRLPVDITESADDRWEDIPPDNEKEITVAGINFNQKE